MDYKLQRFFFNTSANGSLVEIIIEPLAFFVNCNLNYSHCQRQFNSPHQPEVGECEATPHLASANVSLVETIIEPPAQINNMYSSTNFLQFQFTVILKSVFSVKSVATLLSTNHSTSIIQNLFNYIRHTFLPWNLL